MSGIGPLKVKTSFQTKFQSNIILSSNDIILPSLTLHGVILGQTNEVNNIYSLLNHILLVFEYYAYRPREKLILYIGILKGNLIKIKKNE